MPDLSYRSIKDELMDHPEVREELLHQNLEELDWLNRTTGGHRISIRGLKQLALKRDREYHLVDLGCGSGDSMKYMAFWARKQGYKMSFTGVDRNPAAISFLRKNCRDIPEIKGTVEDAFRFLGKAKGIDILHCSLFCHHMSDSRLKQFFALLKEKVGTGVIINDLKRSRMAWYSARWFTKIANGSRLSRHDGPLSVQKAFLRHELEELLKGSGLQNFRIRSQWPFRYLITINLQT